MARNRTGHATQQRILNAIRSLIAEGGLEAVTIRAVCARAAIRAGSFYNLFPGKDRAVLSVIGDTIAAYDPDPDAAGGFGVSELADQYVTFVQMHPDIARIYLQLAVAQPRRGRELAARIARHNEVRIARFAAALAADGSGSDGDRARILVAGLNGLALNWLVDPGLDLPGLANRFVAALESAPHRQ